MTALYVLGGQQRILRPLRAGQAEWHGYQKGLIYRVDPSTGETEVSKEYVSPPEVCADGEPEILFQAATVEEGKLYACTQTEVMVYALPSFELLHYISLPCFNDVHHVRPTPDNNLLVANGGLDMVLEITLQGEIVRMWNALGEEPWSRFSPDVDYRKVASTKPHRAHPNYVFHLGDEPWATRFEQMDAISLLDPRRRIEIGLGRIHDGVVHQGYIYFSVVNGHLAIANADTLRIEEVVDLNAMSEPGTLLGWCRSILPDGDKVWVGFSRIRPTKVRENVTWIARGFRRLLPAHIACYDLKRSQCLTKVDVEEHGMSAIFSILPAPNQP